MGVSVAAIAAKSSVGPFRSIYVMYVKCFSLVRYRPYIPSGTLLLTIVAFLRQGIITIIILYRTATIVQLFIQIIQKQADNHLLLQKLYT